MPKTMSYREALEWLATGTLPLRDGGVHLSAVSPEAFVNFVKRVLDGKPVDDGEWQYDQGFEL